MSRRRGLRAADQIDTATCECGQPTRDGAYVCESCLDVLAEGLRSLLPGRDERRAMLVEFGAWCPYPARYIGERVEGLWDTVLSVLAGEKGTDYRKVGGGSGGSDSTGIDLNMRASKVAADVERTLMQLVTECRAAQVSHVAPVREARTTGKRPRAQMVPDMAVWLAWRVDGMGWHPTVEPLVHAAIRAIEAAVWVVDRPPTRQQLGDCPVEGCHGLLSATPGAVYARCSADDHAVEAQPLRDRLLAELGDRLVTAAEFAKLSTYLGVRSDRDKVAARVRQWGHRDQVAAHDSPEGTRYRFGDLYALLVAAEAAAPRTRTRAGA